MISQTDKENIARLREIREHKINKMVITIARIKRTIADAFSSITGFNEEIAQYNIERKENHKKMFDGLLTKKKVTIANLNTYRLGNKNLVDGGQEIANQITLAERNIEEKESEIKEHKETLLILNKKIESLNELLSEDNKF